MAEWKEIKGFSNYEVSNEGVIRNKETKQTIQPHKTTSGYHTLKLYRDNKPYTRQVHRLVAATYLGDSDLDVNHIDGNKTNNNINNLEYVTKSDNMKHAYKLGLIKPYKHKPTHTKEVCCITLNKTYDSVHEASRELSIDRNEIRKVCNGKRKTARGLMFVWR